MNGACEHQWTGRRISPVALLRRFRNNRKGATSVEFALVSVPFFGTLFAIIETAFSFFAAQTLETALSDATRKIFTGQVQGNAAITTADQFRDTVMCDPANRLLPVFIDCTQVKVDVRTVTSFNLASLTKPVVNGVYDTSDFKYDPGAAGSIVVARAVYPQPIYVSLLGTAGTIDLSGRKRILLASATFRNEPF